jgi:hypothetical protein
MSVNSAFLAKSVLDNQDTILLFLCVCAGFSSHLFALESSILPNPCVFGPMLVPKKLLFDRNVLFCGYYQCVGSGFTGPDPDFWLNPDPDYC